SCFARRRPPPTPTLFPYTTLFRSDQVQELLADVAQNNERVVDDPAPAVFCVSLGDSRIDFELRVFVKDPMDIMPLTHEINASVTRALHDAGIQIPFPQRDIHVRTVA